MLSWNVSDCDSDVWDARTATDSDDEGASEQNEFDLAYEEVLRAEYKANQPLADPSIHPLGIVLAGIADWKAIYSSNALITTQVRLQYSVGFC